MVGQKIGFKHRKETKEQISKTLTGRPRGWNILKACPHCREEMNVSNLPRHEPVCRVLANSKFASILGVHTVKEMKAWRRKLKVYGITPDEYAAIWYEQEGLCKICFGGVDILCVDHCHDTGVIRGLLCTACNYILGYAKDRAEVLRQAACYIEDHRKD